MPRKKKSKWTKREQYWFRKRWTRWAASVAVYVLLGNTLTEWMMKLSQNGFLNPISANVLVFGLIGVIIWTVMDYFDDR